MIIHSCELRARLNLTFVIIPAYPVERRRPAVFFT